MERSLCLYLKHQTHTCVESIFKSLYIAIDLKQRISIEVYISSTPSPPLKKHSTLSSYVIYGTKFLKDFSKNFTALESFL